MAAERSWRPGAVAAAAFVVAFVLVQFLWPARALLEPRPVRFAWQMYTTVVPMPEVWTESADGSLELVDTRRLLVRQRAEIDLGRPLAEAVCASRDVAAVVVEGLHGRNRYPCD